MNQTLNLFHPSSLIPHPLLAAALALAAFALFRYWQSLDKLRGHLRWLLIGLRGMALFLLVCALAGMYVEHETATAARVLLSHTHTAGVRDGATANASRDEEQKAREIIIALQQRSLGVVENTAASSAIAEDSKPYVAGVLLTDGAIKADEAALEVNRLSATTGGAPVFVVTNSQQSVGPMVALERVAIMSSPVRGVPLAVRCVVHGRGMRGRESLVTIADEAQVQASARVAWTNDDERQALTLEVVPKVAGWAAYTARVEAANGEEANALSRPLTLYVEERRWRLLFFEGEPTWEAKFIRRALEHSGLFEVDYFAQVSRAAAVGASEKAVEQTDDAGVVRGRGDAVNEGGTSEEDRSRAINSPEAKLHGALASAERLNGYDCIIVGATPNEMLSAAEAARLSVWVERRGGGLVITGGNSFAGSIAAPNGKLYRLLPVTVDPRGFSSEAQLVARGTPLEAEQNREGVMLLPTTAGAGGALSGYLNAAQGTAVKANVLTGQGLRLGATRPGANVLAVAGLGSTIQTSETGTPLIAAARSGAGRTLIFAPADSWRLRTSASGEQDEQETPYSALWQGLILWAAAGARPPVEIILSDDAPAAGEKATAEIRVRDALFAPAKIEKLSARLQLLTENDGESATDFAQPGEIPFVPDESDASVWRAVLPKLPPGQYALETDYSANGKSGSTVKRFAVVASHTSAPGEARDTLSRAARETGGELLVSDDATALAERLSAISFSPEKTRRPWELRSWWPLAYIIPLLLSAAWLIERMRDER